MPSGLEQIAIDRETIGHALKDRTLYVPVLVKRDPLQVWMAEPVREPVRPASFL